MGKRELGEATYAAVRLGQVVRIFAKGTAPNFNTKFDLEKLPFRIYPPMFGFYFVEPDIILPAQRPFVYEEDVAYPDDQGSIVIMDATGRTSVPIHTVAIPAITAAMIDAGSTEKDFCVFEWIGKDTLKIAKCSAILPAVYKRVFGPDTLAACEDYVSKSGQS